MTTAAAGAADPGAWPVPERRVVTVAGVPMSALVAAVADPRLVIVALHGGAVTSSYYDYPGHPRLSLLQAGAAAGYTVIALDRPGYGASAAYPDSVLTPEPARAALVFGAVDALLAGSPRGAGVFLMAHSMGCVLAVQTAALSSGAADGAGLDGAAVPDSAGLGGTGLGGAGLGGTELGGTAVPRFADGTGLLGLEIAGIGQRPHPGAEFMAPLLRPGLARPGRDKVPRRATLNAAMWTPPDLYPPGAVAALDVSPGGPGYESGDIRGWTEALPSLAAEVRVPVRYTLGDHEQVWDNSPEAMESVASLFTASPYVVPALQPGAAHNLSRGWSAADYHARVFAFAERCIPQGQRAPEGPRAPQGPHALEGQDLTESQYVPAHPHP